MPMLPTFNFRLIYTFKLPWLEHYGLTSLAMVILLYFSFSTWAFGYYTSCYSGIGLLLLHLLEHYRIFSWLLVALIHIFCKITTGSTHTLVFFLAPYRPHVKFLPLPILNLMFQVGTRINLVSNGFFIAFFFFFLADMLDSYKCQCTSWDSKTMLNRMSTAKCLFLFVVDKCVWILGNASKDRAQFLLTSNSFTFIRFST